MARPERVASVYPSSESEIDNGTSLRKSKTMPSATDLGKRVMFTSSKDDRIKYGTLRYLGKPEFSTKGQWCGVELDEPKGKNNGSVRGIRYFSCPQNTGIFVPLGKVEIDPIGDARARTKSTAGAMSLVEKRARKAGKYGPSPFFYNTMPRSLSIPALNEGFVAYDKPIYRLDTSPEHKPLTTKARARTPLSPVDHGPTSYQKSFPPSPLKKYTSEVSILQKVQPNSKVSNPVNIKQSSPSRKPARRPMGSFSEVPLMNGLSSGSLRSSISCHNLSTATNRKLSSTSQFSKKPSPIDSEDSISYYSSTSDLSHGESDTDLTPHSSSTSPCFIDIDVGDTPLLLKPPSPPPRRGTKSTSHSPTHMVNLPTGLDTPTLNLIEKSRTIGSGECRIPSPDHQKNSKIYQNARNGRSTLDHPLVNGRVAYGRDNSDKENSKQNTSDVFVCPTSGQEMSMQSKPVSGALMMSEIDMKRLQDDLSACLRQQVAMEERMGRMEESLLKFQSIFMKTMEQMQETLKHQMEFNQLRQRTVTASNNHQLMYHPQQCDQGLGHLIASSEP